MSEFSTPGSAYNTPSKGEQTIHATAHCVCIDIRSLWQKHEKLVKDGILLMHVDQKKDPKIVRVWLLYTAATVWIFCTGCLLAAGLAENCPSWPLLARLVIEKSWYYCIKILSLCVHNTLMPRCEWFPKHSYLGESLGSRGSHSYLGKNVQGVTQA